MNSAAFEEPSGDELARILRELADKVEGKHVTLYDWHTLIDSYGNTVGTADCYKARK